MSDSEEARAERMRELQHDQDTAKLRAKLQEIRREEELKDLAHDIDKKRLATKMAEIQTDFIHTQVKYYSSRRDMLLYLKDINAGSLRIDELMVDNLTWILDIIANASFY